MKSITYKPGVGMPIRIQAQILARKMSGLSRVRAKLVRSILDLSPLVEWDSEAPTSNASVDAANGILTLDGVAALDALDPGSYIMDIAVNATGGVWISPTIEVKIVPRLVAVTGGGP